MSTALAGQVIDSYRIVRQVGAGGMGEVYEAVHVVLGQRVALKLLTSDFRAQPALLQRFTNEAKAASQIDHPGIVKVYDLGQFKDGMPWLSMEYLDGQVLSSRIHAADQGPRTPLGMDSFWIIGDLASALAAAHEKGIIHRDLKPANVMIVADPATMSGERAKVLDFGVAKLQAEQMTKRGAMLGTPSYMALEQFKSATDVDGRADVFSLGVIAYEILAGRRPHSGQSHFEVMTARMSQPIPPIKELIPSLADPVAALVMRMLDSDREQRPTMSEVELEVRRALGLPPPRSSPTSGPGAAVAGPSSTPSGKPTGLTPMTPNTPLTPLTLLPDRGLATAAPVPSPPPPRLQRVLRGVGAALLAIASAAGGAFALWPQPPRPTPVEEAPPQQQNNAPLPLPPAPPPPAVVDPVNPPLPEPVPPPAAPPPSSPSCEPPTLATCTITPPLSEELGSRLFSGIRGAGATWCSDEALQLSGLPDAPLIAAAPTSLRPEIKDTLLFTLRGMLRGRDYPAKLKIVCRAR